MVRIGRMIIVSLGVLFTSLCLYVWPAMSAATIFGTLSGVALAVVALSMRWRRTAIWAAVAAVMSIANFALLMSRIESGTTWRIGWLLPAIVALVLTISYIAERRRCRYSLGAS